MQRLDWKDLEQKFWPMDYKPILYLELCRKTVTMYYIQEVIFLCIAILKCDL